MSLENNSFLPFINSLYDNFLPWAVSKLLNKTGGITLKNECNLFLNPEFKKLYINKLLANLWISSTIATSSLLFGSAVACSKSSTPYI